jgi:anti-sigma factor RsiW
MTPPNPHPDPDAPWLELLAAYVDDELDDATREEVARWLAAHPEAKAELRAQQTFSPDNWRLWRKAEPPMPSEDAWCVVRNEVAARTERKADPAPRPVRRSAWKWIAGTLATAGTAAAVMLGGGTPKVPPAPPPFQTAPVEDDGQYAELVVLPVIGPDDVEFHRVPGDAVAFLPLGAVPTVGRLVLASADDVRIEEAEPSATWPGKMTPGPGDMPMIFASKP